MTLFPEFAMENRQFLLLSVFFFSLFMLWQGWQEQHRLTPNAASGTTQATSASTALPAQPASSPTSAEIPAAAHATAGGLAAAINATAAPVNGGPATIQVRTDLFAATFSAQGGDLVHLALLKHKSDDKKSNMVLLDPSLAYAAQSGLTGGAAGEALPNHKSLWQLPAQDLTLEEGQNEIRLRLFAQTKAAQATRTYIFRRGSYLIDVEYAVRNDSGKPLSPEAYFQLTHSGQEAPNSIFSIATFTGPAFYTQSGKFQKLHFSDVLKGKGPEVETAQEGWVAMVQHYFVSAWLPQDATPRAYYAHKIANDGVASGLIAPLGTLAPEATGHYALRFYAGPQEQETLANIAPGFQLVVDYGWLTVIAAPIFWVLQFIHKITNNWGWAIILLTVLIKLLFFPLSAASYRSMAKMRVLTPKLMKLKETYGDDKQRLNTEMMALYKREKVNPLGGCLPILVQIPVFIALYWVLLGSVEMRQTPWLGWIQDLSAADPYYILPLVMGATMLIQTKLNPTPPDPVQAKIMLIMPVVFTAMFITFPAGLVLYWTVNNLLSIAQQWQITRMIEAGNDK